MECINILYLSLSTLRGRRIQNNFQHNVVKVFPSILIIYWKILLQNVRFVDQRGNEIAKRESEVSCAGDRPFKVARPQRSPRRFHFVQWFVITAANMVHAGSSSHPKRQANYNSRQRPRKPLKRAHADGPIRISRALRSYTAPQVNHSSLPLSLL